MIESLTINLHRIEAVLCARNEEISILKVKRSEEPQRGPFWRIFGSPPRTLQGRVVRILLYLLAALIVIRVMRVVTIRGLS